MSKQINLTENLTKLNEIADWFENQESIDVEEGLKKVKVAAELIKESKSRLKEIENEFDEIKKDIEDDSDVVVEEQVVIVERTEATPKNSSQSDDVAPDDIPF
jgi:exonuclease VII small subunit